MSFQEKNNTITMINFSLILIFYLFRIGQMLSTDSFTAENLFWLWGIIIVWAVLITIFATIITHIILSFIEAAKTKKERIIKDISDERDQMIDLKGTKVTYQIYSLGTFLSMLTFVFGKPALIMFSLLIFFGLMAQIIGDITRLYLYRKGI